LAAEPNRTSSTEARRTATPQADALRDPDEHTADATSGRQS